MRDDLYVPEEVEVWYYRGVHGQHPALAEAKLGIVLPGRLDGTVSAEQHNLGSDDVIAASPYTSWTAARFMAEAHARKMPGGVLLRLRAWPTSGPGWSWEISPDYHDEDEMLLLGVRLDAEVVPL